jgi:energy-coupling factor transport system ATP-binding protein
MTPRSLRIHDLAFSYPDFESPQTSEGDAPPLFKGLSFALTPGETGVILGTADAGKTTLARILVGLVPRFSGGRLEGEIRYGEKDVLLTKPCDLLEDIGLVFQDSDEQIFTTRCDTEIAFALESLGLPREEIGKRIASSLERVGLSDFRARNPTTLSGGEKKRLLVACLLAVDPALWILDESLEELDAAWKARVLDILRDGEATTLILDSRMSEVLERTRGVFALLARGSIAVSPSPGRPEGLRTSFETEGIIIEAGAVTLSPPRAQTAPYLKAEGIRFSFPEPGSFSLEIESLELGKGTVCALVGPNGSGKSTLARLLCGLSLPQKGGFWIDDGKGYEPAAPELLSRRVGFLFQNPDHQIYLPTVQEELALGLKNRGLARARIDERVREAVRLFRLQSPQAAPALMSYGSRRRLQAAVYWLLDRDMLILDEVDSGLSFRDLAEIVRELCSRTPCVILITHDERFASAADRILVMERGRIVRDFRPRGGG